MMRQSDWLFWPVILVSAGLAMRDARADPIPAFTLYQPSPQLEISGQSDDPLPVIVTYELKRQSAAVRAIARNPKAFWVKQIVARIEAIKEDAPQGLKDARTVKLSFVVARDGHLVSKGVSTSSGSAVADKAAVAMLERAQPFPPMPDTMSDSELSFNLPVRFR